MIQVKLIKNSNKVKKITIIGHADYDKYGRDIVCASVSSVVILTINNILTIDKEAVSYSLGDILTIDILKDVEIVNTLIDNMLKCLIELAGDYPKNIKLEEENNE